MFQKSAAERRKSRAKHFSRANPFAERWNSTQSIQPRNSFVRR